MADLRAPCARTRPGARARAALLALAAAAALACSGSEGQRPERVLLVTIDTLRADRVGCYGAVRARTPTLDRLAAEGVRWEVALSPAPLTLPSHATVMTGREPDEHGVRANGTFALGGGVPTLAEGMRAAGFATAAFVGAFVLDEQFGLARGFEHYDDQVSGRRSGDHVGYAERRADAVADAFRTWLDGAPPRFFAWIHFYDPHSDYDPPAGFSLLFPGDRYAGEIAYVDYQLGRVLEAIAARFDLDRTLVVATSDHGEALGQHGEASHSYGVYEATQRVPLVARGPGFRGGRVEPGPVRLADVAPTILAEATGEALPGASGRDLRAAARGEDDPSYHETLATRFDHGWSALFAARTPRWKYIRAPRPELYDLAADPAERDNVADRHLEVSGALDAWLAARRERAAPLAARAEVSREDRERLAALGYAAGAPAAAADLSGPDPKDRIALLAATARAEQLARAGRHSEAHDLLAALPEPGPMTLALRASYAIGAGRFADAEADARSALAQAPERLDFSVLLGQGLEGQQRLEAAAEAYRRAAQADPHDPMPWSGLGRTAELAGDREGAARDYERALEIRPGDPEAAWRLAALRLESGKVEEGRRLLSAAGAPPNLLVALRVAAVEAEAGRPAEAAEILERALGSGKLPDSLVRAGAALLELGGRLEAALRLREDALRGEASWERENEVAWTLALLGRDLDRALELALRAARSSRGAPHVLDTLALVHLARGEGARSLAVADRALRGAPPELRSHLLYVRAAALASLGRGTEARAAVASALAAPASENESWRTEARALADRLAHEPPS